MEPLSCYILTHNSERYLRRVLSAVCQVADELVLVDSGSTDGTSEIARDYPLRFMTRPLDDFARQRTFALKSCSHRWVLTVDSDEVLDDELIASLLKLKSSDFRLDGKAHDAYRIARRWFVMGREVHAFFPVASPDYPLRLFRKDRLSYPGTERVHEAPTCSDDVARLPGSLLHYSCVTEQELWTKLELYSTLHADDLKSRRVKPSWLYVMATPPAAWLKWFIVKGGYKDGRVGWLLSKYAMKYTYLKYRKLQDA